MEFDARCDFLKEKPGAYRDMPCLTSAVLLRGMCVPWVLLVS